MSNQLQVQVQSLRSFLSTDTVRQQIQFALPKGLTVDRVLRQVFTLVQTNVELLKCTQLSILRGIIQASELGLELSGPMGHAYLVPRFSKKAKAQEACFQIGWKGLVVLVYRGGHVATFRLKSAFANDYFRWEEGSSHVIEHIPARDGPRGDFTHFYAVSTTHTGQKDFEVMTLQEVIDWRNRYAQGWENPLSAWSTSFEGMAHKTVARKLAKRLPASVELQEAIGAEEQAEVLELRQPALTRSEVIAEQLEAPAEEETPNADTCAEVTDPSKR
jgi:recombination protein RecT